MNLLDLRICESKRNRLACSEFKVEKKMDASIDARLSTDTED